MAEFKLSNETLRRMMTDMSHNMDKGLEGGPNSSTVSMLPSFVPELPDGTGYCFIDFFGSSVQFLKNEIFYSFH